MNYDFREAYFESCKYKYRCIRVYGWLKDDKYVIWMWIWLILKNISLLDRIWSLWLVSFAHSSTNFIFWLGRLIFSVSINSHPDNIICYSAIRQGIQCDIPGLGSIFPEAQPKGIYSISRECHIYIPCLIAE
jgi:hypothetical protein